MAIWRRTLPHRLVASAKRELLLVHREAMAEGLEPDARVALIGASCKIRDQLMDLISIPRRPASSPAKGRPEIPIEAAGSILATEVPIPPSETAT